MSIIPNIVSPVCSLVYHELVTQRDKFREYKSCCKNISEEGSGKQLFTAALPRKLHGCVHEVIRSCSKGIFILLQSTALGNHTHQLHFLKCWSPVRHFKKTTTCCDTLLPSLSLNNKEWRNGREKNGLLINL